MRGNKESVHVVRVCGGAGAQLGHTGLSGGGGEWGKGPSCRGIQSLNARKMMIPYCLCQAGLLYVDIEHRT